MRATLAVLVLLAACQPADSGVDFRDTLPEVSGALLLRLERTGCFGWCPAYVIEVDTDGTVRYIGNNDVITLDSASATLAPAELAELRDALDRADFANRSVRCCDCQGITDMPSATITVADGRPPKTIHDYHGCSRTPRAIRELEESIDRIIGTERWIGTVEEHGACLWGAGDCPTRR